MNDYIIIKKNHILKLKEFVLSDKIKYIQKVKSQPWKLWMRESHENKMIWTTEISIRNSNC